MEKMIWIVSNQLVWAYLRILKCLSHASVFTFLCITVLCEGYTSRRARMSCGHTVTPLSLTLWCQRQLDEVRYLTSSTNVTVTFHLKYVWLLSSTHYFWFFSSWNWKGGARFTCGQTNCNVEWSFEEVCKMALLTPKEKKCFEDKLFANVAKNKLNAKSVSIWGINLFSKQPFSHKVFFIFIYFSVQAVSVVL